MATTYRRAAVAPKSGGTGPHGSAAQSRKYNNSTYLDRQHISSAEEILPLETMVPLLAVAAEKAYLLHARSHGSTVSVYDGSLLGQLRFAVSIYPDRSIDLTESPTRDLLFAFAVLNADLLCLRDHALGTWFDRQRNRHVLDVVVCPSRIEDAICLGVKHSQRAIFDLKGAKDIPLLRDADVVLTRLEDAR